MRLIAFFLIAAPVFPQTLQLVPPANAKPSQTATLPITLNVSGGIAAIQFTVKLPPDVSSVVVSGSLVGKRVSCGPVKLSAVTCLLYGMNADVIPPGEVAELVGVLSPAASTNPEVFALVSTKAASSAAKPVTLTAGAAVSIPLLSKCDLNSDGVTDGKDADLLRDIVLGNSPPNGINPDLDGDGSGDIDDVMLVVIAALPGGICSAK